MATLELTQELVKRVFEYKDGFLYWKVKFARVNIGDKAGGYKDDNRRRIKFCQKTLFASRLIFLWHHGYLPETVDHIDRNPDNNNIENLRAATFRENAKNKTSAKNSSSQYLGVSLQGKYWGAFIQTGGRVMKNLGRFINEGDAALAYNRAAVKHHGEFANLNIVQPKEIIIPTQWSLF